ncbi:MAG: MFS transporter [Pseudomonadota bacterium]
MSDAPQHSSAFKLRRFLNWFPLGLTYAFLYMGRYNLTVSKNALGDLMTKEDFGVIFGVGTVTYAFAFLINGPLTDRIGGKRAILIGSLGSGIVNLCMGLYISALVGGAVGGDTSNLRLYFSLLYAVNMYFQSYGAVAIVKVNAHWFHVRERGGFSGIFGTMISSGIFFAFTVNGWILDFAAKGSTSVAASKWVFYVPSAILFIMFVVELFLLKDRPGLAGFQDFDTGDASSGEENVEVKTLDLIKRILTNPIILTVAFIEFCTGVLRNGVMHWYPIYAKEVLSLPSSHLLVRGDMATMWSAVGVGAIAAVVLVVVGSRLGGSKRGWTFASAGLCVTGPFILGGWGGILFVAGVIGANVAGWVSDLFFQSRRAPTAGFLYLGCAVSAILMFFTLGGVTREVGWSELKPVEGFDQLQVGDEILSIAGVDKIETWKDVSRAVMCLPATCKDGSTWDVDACMCKTKPGKAALDRAVSDGSIPLTVRRAGQELTLRLQDAQASMRAGDTRALKAGPHLTLSPLWMGAIVFLVSLCVIGTHGLLSGTATMDFGGRRGAATAVGMIDGFVYLGTGFQSFMLGYLTTRVGWWSWPLFLFPFAVIGFVLLLRIWKVVPKGKGGH